MAILSSIIIGATPSLLAKLFSTKVRYSGLEITYNIGFAIFGGLTPMVVTLLIHHLQSPVTVAWNLLLAALVRSIALITINADSVN